MVFVDTLNGEYIDKYHPWGQYWSLYIHLKIGYLQVGWGIEHLMVLMIIPSLYLYTDCCYTSHRVPSSQPPKCTWRDGTWCYTCHQGHLAHGDLNHICWMNKNIVHVVTCARCLACLARGDFSSLDKGGKVHKVKAANHVRWTNIFSSVWINVWQHLFINPSVQQFEHSVFVLQTNYCGAKEVHDWPWPTIF